MAPKLETLLARYEADLQRLSPSARRKFVCPICLESLVWTEHLRRDITIEHIVPKSLAGRMTTLTCKKCNNTAGTELESHLVQRVQLEGRKKPILAGVEFCDTKFRGKVHLPDSADYSMKLFGFQKQSDPREIDKFGRLLSEGVWDGQELKLNLELGFAPALSVAALVRSAYLLMFRLFGYRYVYSRSAAVIRKSITDPLVETDVLKAVSWRVDVRPPTENGVSIVTKPGELRSFMIFLTLDKGQDHVSAIALPPPNAGLEFFNLLGSTKSPRRCTLSTWLSGDNEEIVPLDDVLQSAITKDATKSNSR